MNLRGGIDTIDTKSIVMKLSLATYFRKNAALFRLEEDKLCTTGIRHVKFCTVIDLVKRNLS